MLLCTQESAAMVPIITQYLWVRPEVQAVGADFKVKQFYSPVELDESIVLLEGAYFSYSASIVSDIRIKLPCGLLSIRNVNVWVVDQQMSAVLSSVRTPPPATNWPRPGKSNDKALRRGW